MILVCTTLTTFAMADPGTWATWLETAEGLREHSPEEVQFFAAIEVDGRGEAPFDPLLDRLGQLGGGTWAFSLSDGRRTITTENRLRHITMGQNLCSAYASDSGASHLLFMAADCRPPADAIPKLLELDWPFVGGEVSTYCLHGDPVAGYPFPVEEHMPTAAFVLIRRDVFKVVRWRVDGERGMSDDPCYYDDVWRFFGVRGRVRKDVRGVHWPEAIGPIERRFPGWDMSVQ
jgi:hypothetical protein